VSGQPAPRLEYRLAWRLAAIMLAAIVVAALVVAWRSVDTARSLDDAALASEARALARHLTTGLDGRPVLDLPASMRTAFRQSDDDNLFLVTDAANHPHCEAATSFWRGSSTRSAFPLREIP